MREIRFRGKRLHGPELIIGDLNHIDGKVYIFPRVPDDKYPPNSPDWFEVDPETVGQFTGLKDKNGVQIFENDIVKTERNDNMTIGWSEHFASFIINRDGWMFGYWFGEAFDAIDCEVIGTTFQNPELLK